MLCPNCESGEMSKWHGQHICTNCGYRQEGFQPLPNLLHVLVEDSLRTVGYDYRIDREGGIHAS